MKAGLLSECMTEAPFNDVSGCNDNVVPSLDQDGVESGGLTTVVDGGPEAGRAAGCFLSLAPLAEATPPGHYKGTSC